MQKAEILLLVAQALQNGVITFQDLEELKEKQIEHVPEEAVQENVESSICSSSDFSGEISERTSTTPSPQKPTLVKQESKESICSSSDSFVGIKERTPPPPSPHKTVSETDPREVLANLLLANSSKKVADAAVALNQQPPTVKQQAPRVVNASRFARSPKTEEKRQVATTMVQQKPPRAVNAPRFKRPEPPVSNNRFSCLAPVEEKIFPIQEVHAMPAVFLPPVPPQPVFKAEPFFPLDVSAGMQFDFNPAEWKPVRPKKGKIPERKKEPDVVNRWPGRRRGKITTHLAYIKDAQSGNQIMMEGNHLESQSFRVGDVVSYKVQCKPGQKPRAVRVCHTY